MTNVILQTNLGAITLEINAAAAPNTAQNFLEYCKAGFYDNTIFHRVIAGFMIQGGGLNADMSPKATNKPITNEANNGLKNEVGTIAMARTSDPHSATAQFFINVAKNDFLNFRDQSLQGWGYCVFGKVIDGMDVVMQISQVNTINRSGHQDVPEVNVVLEKAEIVTADVTANS
jgi:peptidyl-prolyl cis-trans isomerase B (cyclophilin B)